MAKLAAFPKCFVKDISEGRMPLEEWLDMAAELPIDGVEMYDKFLKSHDRNYLAEVRRRIEDTGKAMPMMCYSPDFTVADPARRAEEINKQKETIQVTAALGGSFCRILSGQKRPNLPVDEGIKMVAEAISACIPTAESCGIVLAMENHYKDPFWDYPEFAQKMDVFIKIVDQIDSSWFGVQFDPSNSIVAGENPLNLLKAVKHRVVTMHASDRYVAPGASLDDLKGSDGTIGYSPLLMHGVIGKGLNDYDAIFSTLKNVGFDGWISIEDGENGLEEMRESALFLLRKMAEHGLS